MSRRIYFVLAAVSGILGTVALSIYFSAPFWFLPLPPANATVGQVASFGKSYHGLILFDAWLQQIGTLLSVVFAMALVHLAKRSNSFSGKLVLVSSTVILVLSLSEGTFILGAVQAGLNGHYESSLTCVDLAGVFIHIFLLAPSLFLVLGYALLKSDILPIPFAKIAIVLGVLFQVLGMIGLFNNAALMIVIFVLLAQNIWTICASVSLLFNRRNDYDTSLL